MPGSNCPSCGAPFAASAERCQYCGQLNPTLTTLEQKQARIRELRQALGQRAPSYEEALELGELHLALNQTAHAEEYLRRAIELDPGAVHPRLLLCLTLLGFNQPVLNPDRDADAIQEQFAWLRDHHPDLPEVRWLAHYFELDRLARSRDWKTAIRRGSQAVSEFPDNYLLQFMYGLALVRFGDTKRLKRADYRIAIHHMRLAAELNPNYEPAVKNLKALEDLAAQARK